MDSEMNWETHIQSYLSSGLSLASYCKKVGIKAHQLSYRYRRYRQQQKPPSSATPMGTLSDFIPVQMKKSVSEKGTGFEVHFPNGCYCLIPVSFDERAVAQLIRLLQS